ncbi:hypothetical protein ILUMI_22211 [Ignelater luminosus]|uniref:Fibronectin type-III domain-containing protein n=1 Tax=Ignelater luminosus TaxID=2038154 RepID=A0A8K0CG82_IGNLU|nr:hypothetical protein ILUMI_22211 [Ignelater luminosus]
MDEDATSPKEESNEQTEQQQEKGDILKDQIMDTEDLLRIVETDKEDSSGRNSPRSPEENIEAEKMVDAETDKMDYDRLEERVAEDVDIDESSFSKECGRPIVNPESLEEVAEEPEASAKTPVNVIQKESHVESIEQEIENSEEDCIIDNSSGKTTEDNEDMELVAEESEEVSSSKPAKRSSTELDLDSDSKKLKLNESEKADDKEVDHEIKQSKREVRIHTLNAIEEYIKFKSLKKLTYQDLEQIILQKICEAIGHKSEIGELRHQLAFQEKNGRNVEERNARLNNVKKKYIVPVKISRSVGLQVNGPSNVLFPIRQNKINVLQASPNNKVNTVNNKVATLIKQTIPEIGPIRLGTSRLILVDNNNSKASLSKVIQASGHSSTSVADTNPSISTLKSSVSSTTNSSITVKPRDPKTLPNPTEVDHRRPYNQNQAIKVIPNLGNTVGNRTRIVYIKNNHRYEGESGLAKSNALEANRLTTTNNKSVLKHPASLPPPPANQASIPSRKPVPPEPRISIKRSQNGLVLSWRMPYNLNNYEVISSYQLYAYQETTSLPSTNMWRKVGEVKALPLPMACTLTQFAAGNKYHFAVRAVDILQRMGPFSDIEQILL